MEVSAALHGTQVRGALPASGESLAAAPAGWHGSGAVPPQMACTKHGLPCQQAAPLVQSAGSLPGIVTGALTW